eukprot:scaffold39292_cov309-Isochrysis_galbana.AAC.1
MLATPTNNPLLLPHSELEHGLHPEPLRGLSKREVGAAGDGRGAHHRTLTLHRRVAHLKLRGSLRDGAGGKDLWIGKLRVEAHRAAMDNSCGSGKAIHI